MVRELLGDDTVDEIIDYTKIDPRDVIQPGTVDFSFDTVSLSMEYLSLMRPHTGCIISVSTLPSGDQLQASSLMQLPHQPILPLPIKLAPNFMDYTHLDELTHLIESGKLRTIVGTAASLRDIKSVQEACQVVHSGRGGLGKVVIKVVDE
ncbi:hypothetical protein BDV59DRAFT_180259 [Aspergillus ambiguus]|uniref:uncharacterized protein n=1 Tax=Aspergillus ambiguus TaxID=176160 RepID=UPI003CCCCC0B